MTSWQTEKSSRSLKTIQIDRRGKLVNRDDVSLAVSRAFGDTDVPGVTYRPYVRVTRLSACRQYSLALVSDGVTDVFSDGLIATFAIQLDADRLVSEAVRVVDNITLSGADNTTAVLLTIRG